MLIREALLQQHPSLQLQRAAADEIARLDAQILTLQEQARQSHAQMLAVVFNLERRLESANDELGAIHVRYGI